AEALLEAAQVLGRHPGSIQLRYLQTLADIANERSSIVAFPIPVDLLSRLTGGAAPPAAGGDKV
ncbi:MAG: slipin family protein, partial [Gammaproteobacteria bacterium]